MPIPDSIFSEREQKNFYHRYFTRLSELEKKYTGIFYMDRNILHYPDSLFSDGSHLNRWGVMRFNKTDYKNLVENAVLPHLKIGKSIYLISHRHEDQLEADEVLAMA